MPASVNDAPRGAERRLLAALGRALRGAEFSARAAAADLDPRALAGRGVSRPDAASCGRWLRSHRSATLVGKPDRTGVVRWRLRGAAAPVAARQAPAPAARAPAPPQAQQVPQPAPSLRRRPNPRTRPRRRPSAPGGICPPRRPIAVCRVRAGDAEHGGRLTRIRRRERQARSPRCC
jgi:hypothetical protein